MTMTRAEYLLTCLAEECTEVGQRVCKAIRFGLDEVQAGQKLTNAERILDEMHDLIAVYEILESELLVPNIGYVDSAAKLAKIEKFMAISRAQGIIE